MASDRLRTVVRHLAAGRSVAEPTDRQLLERFATRHDEDAFAALVGRHGRLVWGVCWRTLRHTQDAEDAFQATFLVLARKAASVQWRDSVANWLYGAAARVAAEARTRQERDRVRHAQAAAIPDGRAAPDAAARELCAALDEELDRLPEQYRAPLLLCYLEGRTSDQAARQLGWSLRTLERRLAQGRERLRARLTRRGFTFPAVLLTVTLTREAAVAAMPAGLSAATTKAAVSPTTSGAAVALAEATSKGMTMSQSKIAVLAVALAVATAGGGFALLKPDTPQPPTGGAVPPAAGAKNGDATTDGAASLANRVWALMEVVQNNHLEPPSRAVMTLAGAKALLKASKAAAPDDLSRRAAGVATEDQLAALFRDLWPGGEAGRDAKLEPAALNGFLDSIPGRPFVRPDAQVRIDEQLRDNRYVGVGIKLSVNAKEQLTQIDPFRRGAARLAGAKTGDLLLEVDGKSTKDASLEKVVAWLRGPEGTPVTAVVRQPGSTETRTLKMVRAVIPIDSVLGFRRASEDEWDYRIDRGAGIAYVWVKAIKSSTLHELRQVERRLRSDGVRAVILDFRFSEGDGHLHDTALVADGLLDGGLMWSVRGRGDEVKEYRADREALFRGLPLAVLMNGTENNGQALVLAAIQDSGRAVLVGEPTANDGHVRSLFPLPDKSTVTVLTGRLGRATKDRGWPVRPDRTVALGKEQRAAVLKWLTEKELAELPAGTDDRPPEDPQLDRALAVLRESLKSGDKP